MLLLRSPFIRTYRCSFCIPDHDCLNYGYADHLHQQLPDYLEQIVLRLTFNPPHLLSPLKNDATTATVPRCRNYFPLLTSDTLQLLLLLQSHLHLMQSTFYNIYPSVAEDKRMKQQQRNTSHSVTFLFAMLMKYYQCAFWVNLHVWFNWKCY